MKSENDSAGLGTTDRVLSVVIHVLWISVVAMLMFGVTSSCRADCREGLVDRLIDVDHDGAEGFFVATADVECFLRQAEISAGLEARIALFEERADRADARYANMLQATALGTEVIATQDAVIASTTRRAISAEHRADAWHRSPFVWLAVGMAVSLVGVGVVVLAL